MSNFFKPEDTTPVGSTTGMYIYIGTANKLLLERGVRVYAAKNEAYYRLSGPHTTHQALLINIEELPKPACTEHEAWFSSNVWACRFCGIKLKMAWSPA